MNNKKIDEISELILSYIYNTHSKIANTDTEVTKYFSSVVEKFQFPHSHARVLIFLTENESAPISTIAKNLNISKPNMTPIINNLIKYDLVKKIQDKNDKRITRIELTSYAHEIINEFRSHYKATIIEMLNKLSDSDIISFCDSINNINRIISKLY